MTKRVGAAERGRRDATRGVNGAGNGCGKLRQGRLIFDHRIEVTNEFGDKVGTVRFRDIVTVRETT